MIEFLRSETDAAFDRMVGGYERPDRDEGFESIKDVKAWWAK